MSFCSPSDCESSGVVPCWRARWVRRPAGVRLWSGGASSCQVIRWHQQTGQVTRWHQQTGDSPAQTPAAPHWHSAPEAHTNTAVDNCLMADQRGAFWDRDSYLFTGVHAYSAILKSQSLFVASPLFRKSCNAELRTERTQLTKVKEGKQKHKAVIKTSLYLSTPRHTWVSEIHKQRKTSHTQTHNTLLHTHTHDHAVIVKKRNRWLPLYGVKGHCGGKDKQCEIYRTKG